MIRSACLTASSTLTRARSRARSPAGRWRESLRLATMTLTPLSRRFWAWACPCDAEAEDGDRLALEGVERGVLFVDHLQRLSHVVPPIQEPSRAKWRAGMTPANSSMKTRQILRKVEPGMLSARPAGVKNAQGWASPSSTSAERQKERSNATAGASLLRSHSSSGLRLH